MCASGSMAAHTAWCCASEYGGCLMRRGRRSRKTRVTTRELPCRDGAHRAVARLTRTGSVTRRFATKAWPRTRHRGSAWLGWPTSSSPGAVGAETLALSLPAQACQTISSRGSHHHASLGIAASGCLMAWGRIADKPAGGQATSPHAPCLACPRITSSAAVLPAQRHVEDSIATPCHPFSYAPTARLGPCPRCGRASAKTARVRQRTDRGIRAA